MYSRNITESEGEMNALELADKLDLVRIELTIQASTMLRKQQAEIEALKQHWSEPQTDLIVLLREEVTLMQKYLQEQNLREHFVAWRHEK
jgi:hypothetical protein